jgi:DNA-binding CsgD family transcriptional regulator
VGRGSEVGVLRGLVAAAAEGRGGVAWVEGEPGIGKSALVAEGLAGAAGLGCAVFGAAADPLRARFPLGVLLDCLGADARSPDGERGEIAALLRGEGVGGLLPAGGAVAAAAERVLVLMDRLCAVSPVVLVIDDLQWADEASVSVWHRLAGATAQVPLLLVAVARPVPRWPGLVLAREGVAHRGGTVVAVGPMPPAEVSALVASVAGGQPGPALLGQASQAGGNPLYVQELVAGLVREDRVRVSGGRAELTGAAGAGAAGPVSLAAAIEDRLAFLSDRAVAVLRMAAVLGPRFSVPELALVAGERGPELTRLVEEAVAAGVLVESGLELAFRHGPIQQALTDGMPAGLRTELHREAAQALAGAGAEAERVAGQLLSIQGDVDEWVAQWLAAHAAVLVHRAPQGIAELLARAVASLPAGDQGRELLMEQLAGVLFLLARYDLVEPTARELLTQTTDPLRRARMAWTLAYTLVRTGRATEAISVVDQALRDQAAPAVWRARLRSARASVLANSSRFGEADVAAAEALADGERTGDRFASGYALHTQSLVRASSGDRSGGLEIMERALAVIGDDPETTDLRLLLLGNRLTALSNLGREAGAEARQLLALAEGVGTARISTVRAAVAEYMFEAGRWDDALAELEAVFDPGADQMDVAVVLSRGLAALIAAHRDDRAGLSAHLHAAAQLPDLPDYHRIYGQDVLRARAVAAERDGQPDVAVTFLEAAVAAVGIGVPAELHWRADLVRCALAAGDRATAEAAAVRCEEEAARRGGPGMTAPARWSRGLADADPLALGQAVAYYRTITRPLELGQVLEDLAVVHAAAGDVAAARLELREAVQIFAGLGAEWDILRADTRVRPYGVRRRRAGTRRPETGWEALTPTEEKIARLVGEGLSNPDIAARLFLSRNTVQVHMSKILAKLQVHSRVEVAMAVARRPAGEGNAAQAAG